MKSKPHRATGQTGELHVIVVDDERLMRQHMISRLSYHPEVKVVGEADSVTTATTLLMKFKPQAVFLDVRMAGEDGFSLIPVLEEMERPPAVVFVTAFDEYAIRAFETSALDYLTKPVNPDRLKKTIGKLLGKFPTTVADQPIPGSVAIPLPEKAGLELTDVEEIRAVEAHGNYTLVLLGGNKSSMVKRSLTSWGEMLPAGTFLKVNRGLIINTERITRIENLNRERNEVHFQGRSNPLILSRVSAERLKKSLKTV